MLSCDTPISFSSSFESVQPTCILKFLSFKKIVDKDWHSAFQTQVFHNSIYPWSTGAGDITPQQRIQLAYSKPQPTELRFNVAESDTSKV